MRVCDNETRTQRLEDYKQAYLNETSIAYEIFILNAPVHHHPLFNCSVTV